MINLNEYFQGMNGLQCSIKMNTGKEFVINDNCGRVFVIQVNSKVYSKQTLFFEFSKKEVLN